MIRRAGHGLRVPATWALLAVATMLAGSGGSGPHPAMPADSGQQSATASVGDATVRASVLPTLSLDAGIARQYGIERSAGTAMLLVSLRRESTANADATRAQVQATASDLSGHAQRIDLREIRTGEEIDYVGSVAIEAPDSVRFDVIVQREGARATLQFQREFFPR